MRSTNLSCLPEDVDRVLAATGSGASGSGTAAPVLKASTRVLSSLGLLFRYTRLFPSRITERLSLLAAVHCNDGRLQHLPQVQCLRDCITTYFAGHVSSWMGVVRYVYLYTRCDHCLPTVQGAFCCLAVPVELRIRSIPPVEYSHDSRYLQLATSNYYSSSRRVRLSCYRSMPIG